MDITEKINQKDHSNSLLETLKKIDEERGGIASIHSSFTDLPLMIEAHYDFYSKMILKNDQPLPRGIREFLAVKTSELNACNYCFHHHKEALQKNDDPISEEKRNLLEELVTRVTKTPWKASQLKPKFLECFSHAQWLHAIVVISYFNMANRLTSSLDLEIEEDLERLCH